MNTLTVEQLYEQQIKLLPAAEQLRLVAIIAHDLATTKVTERPRQRTHPTLFPGPGFARAGFGQRAQGLPRRL